jgi:hypothetical protein
MGSMQRLLAQVTQCLHGLGNDADPGDVVIIHIYMYSKHQLHTL